MLDDDIAMRFFANRLGDPAVFDYAFGLTDGPDYAKIVSGLMAKHMVEGDRCLQEAVIPEIREMFDSLQTGSTEKLQLALGVPGILGNANLGEFLCAYNCMRMALFRQTLDGVNLVVAINVCYEKSKRGY